MLTKKETRSRIAMAVMLMAMVTSQLISTAQSDRSITVYQYRHVPDDKIEEFVKRETTYWSKVAEKAVKDKSMTFWALLEKIGGYDLPNSSNYLFVNTFPNIDKVNEVFSNVEATAGVKISEMETGSISTTTSQFFLHDEGWVQDAKVDPPNDFNYVVMVYHNTEFPDSLIGLENKYWSPFIKKAMDNNQTTQMGWGNARVLAPLGDNIKFTTVSYDLYKTLHEALLTTWDPKTVIPTKALNMINKLEVSRRGIAIYRVVKVVSAN
jgi:hypothetical protein